jgi:hypothetical protein
MDSLYDKLKKAELIDEMGNIVLENFEDGSRLFIDRVSFEDLFMSSFSEDDMYNSLVKEEDGKGYKKYFELWRNEGVIL